MLIKQLKKRNCLVRSLDLNKPTIIAVVDKHLDVDVDDDDADVDDDDDDD